MKQRPLKDYPAPAYPSFQQAHAEPDLLTAVPRCWSGPRFGALVSLGLFAQSLASRADDPVQVKPTVVATPPISRSGPASNKDAERTIRQATAIVAPLLDEALRYDGRGSFGCIAVNPPLFLSEDEALEVIGAELKAAGFDMQEGVPLAGTATLRRPRDTSRSFREEREATDEPVTADDVKTGEHDFDMGDTNRAIYVEYLSQNDYRLLSSPSRSTADSLDFAALAKRYAAALRFSRPDKPAVFGVFFDPLAHPSWRSPDTSGLDPATQRLVTMEQSRAMDSTGDRTTEAAQAKLRRQVRHFIEFLRQQASLPRS